MTKVVNGSTPKYRVLVVENDYDVGQIINDVLEYDGHSVDVANSGRVALSKMEWHGYDVILSDIRMPEMDGPSFYEALTDKMPQYIERLAFMTGDTLSPRVREFLDTSKRPYVEKPITPGDIRELVELLTRDKALRRNARDTS